MIAGADRLPACRDIAARVSPFVAVALVGVAIRLPLATAFPRVSLLVGLWLVADTMMLALVVRTAGRPRGSAILGVLAGACALVWLAAPPCVRDAALATPVIATVMAMLVAAHVTAGAVRARRLLAHGGERRWAAAAAQILPPALVRIAAAELAVIHIALFRWGSAADVPAQARAFAYHRHLTPMGATLLALSTIEIGVTHLFVAHWSRTAALVLFTLSLAGFVYLVGLLKSFRLRPVLLRQDTVRIRAGFLIDFDIPYAAIVAVETGPTGETVRDAATLNAALLAWPNIVLRLKAPIQRRSALKRSGPFGRIALRLDNPDPFVRLLRWRLGEQAR